MKLCYFDESGTAGEAEEITVVVGVVVDAQRMHITKEHWAELISKLSAIVGQQLDELHTSDFYAGNRLFRKISGENRARYISEIIQWFCDRKHTFVHSAVQSQIFQATKERNVITQQLRSPWQAAAFHAVLALQRAHQDYKKTKGHTILVFDNKGQEEKPLANLIASPPDWSDMYYSRSQNQGKLSHIVDAPYFAESKQIPMIQVADFLAYFLRRYAELDAGLKTPKYSDEKEKITKWVKSLSKQALNPCHTYPSTNRCDAANIFYDYCPASLRRIRES